MTTPDLLTRDRDDSRLTLPLAASVAVHAAMALGLLAIPSESRPPMPPVYRVNLVAAPPGERAVGVVSPTRPPPPQPAPEPPRAAAQVPVAAPAARRTAPSQKAAPRATPSPPAEVARPPAPAQQPVAGGGPTGGTGTDVATVRTPGIEFPYGGYLENIVRQLVLRFRPGSNRALVADVSFLIRRDGSVADIRVVRSSGVYAFDVEARGSVEAAGQARAFGALPRGFPDDALPVTISFTPSLLR